MTTSIFSNEVQNRRTPRQAEPDADPEGPNNEDRTDWAWAALEALAEHTGQDLDVDLADAVCDLVSYLGHLCDRNRLQLSAVLRRAEFHYDAETINGKQFEPQPQFDASELATVLVALRLFQSRYTDINAKAIRREWPDHFVTAKGKKIPPLSTEDIDTLCERLNSGTNNPRKPHTLTGGPEVGRDCEQL